MDAFLLILPKKGYINTNFVFKPQGISSDFDITVSLNGSIVSQNKMLEEGTSVFQKFENPGLYEVEVRTSDGLFLKEQVEVADSTQLGTSVLKFIHVNETSDIVLLVKRDRTVLFSHREHARYEMLGVSPTRIIQLNTNYLLFETLIDSKTNSCNFGFFNSKTLKIEHEVEQAKLIHHNQDFGSLVLYEIQNDRLAFIDVRLDYYFDYEEMSTFFSGKSIGVSEIRNYIVNTTEDTIKIINPNSKEVHFECDRQELVLIDAKKELLLKLENGNVYAATFSSTKFRLFELDSNYDISIATCYKHPDFITSAGQAPRSTEFYAELRRKAFEKVWDNDIPMGGSFEVEVPNLPIYQNSLYLFHNINGEVLLQKTNRFSSWSKAACRKSKYHRTQELILWEFKMLQEKSESVSYTFSTNYDLPDIPLEGVSELKINSTKDGQFSILFLPSVSKSYFFLFDTCFTLDGDFSQAKIFGLKNGYYYVLREVEGKHELFRFSRTAIAKQLEFSGVHLYESYFTDYGLIWYSSAVPPQGATGKNTTYIYDVRKGRCLRTDKDVPGSSPIEIENGVFEYPKYSISRNGKPAKDHYLCEHEVFVCLEPFEIKAAVAGRVLGYSDLMNKIITFRDDDGYYLHFYDAEQGFYLAEKIDGLDINYKESELVPNGKSILLKTTNSSRLEVYDLERNEVVSFFNGKFLAFSNEGNIVIEEDMTRNIKVFDPNTFQDITPSQYHYYRFVSPDGKLYSQLSSVSGYYHYLENREITEEEFIQLNKDFLLAEGEDNDAYDVRINNLLDEYQQRYAEEINSEEFKLAQRSDIAGKVAFIQIGITGTDVMQRLPASILSYYNCLSFSYDNNYVGLVGKPFGDGMFQLFKLEFDEQENTLHIADRIVYDEPNKATWFCTFSRNNHFGTYDSNPNSFFIEITDELFKRKYQAFKDVNLRKITKKSFECFSNNGKLAALSEKGYEPMSLGGRGHIASKELHLYDIENDVIVKSYPEHGDFVTFAAFSEDDRKLLSRSEDGVIIVRNINLAKL